MTSDSELVERAKRGDVEAFGELVRRYERSVLAAALGELRDLQAAEDVIQETLLLAYRRLTTLKDATRFGAWLLRIAQRQVVEEARRRRRRVGVPEGQGHRAEQSAVDFPASSGIEHEQLLKSVNRLPAPERALIGLRFFDGLSLAEIADATGRPISTVSKQLSRAIARLRAWVEKDDLS